MTEPDAFATSTGVRFPTRLDAARAVAAGDVDGDGDQDLVFLTGLIFQPLEALVWTNDGMGTFTVGPALALPLLGTDLELLDADQDGDPDAWFTSPSGGALFANDGAGNFDPVPLFSVGTASDLRASHWFDMESDRDLDLLLATDGRNRLFRNDPAGFVEVGTTSLPPFQGNTNAIGSGDLNGDGHLDLVLLDAGSTNRALLNDGTGLFRAHSIPDLEDLVGIHPVGVLIANLDGRPHDDVVALFSGRTLQTATLLLSNGRDDLVDETRTRGFPSHASAGEYLIGDLDRDGDQDIVLANYVSGEARQTQIFLGEGNTGHFRDVTATHFPVDPGAAWGGDLGDVDGDGDLDLILGNADSASGLDRLYLNDGSGRFQEAPPGSLPPLQANTSTVVFADADGDSDLDLLVAFGDWSGSGRNRIFINDGAGRFQDETMTRYPGNVRPTFDLIVKDLDADGDLDLFEANYHSSNRRNRVLLNNGTGVFQDVTLTHAPSANSDSSLGAACGDLDGDGDPDLVIGNELTDVIWWNDGRGRFTTSNPAQLATPSMRSKEILLVDFDGNGTLDITIGDVSSCMFYANDGNGTFRDVTSQWNRTGFGAVTGAFFDWDGDLDPDLIAYDRARNQLLTNTARQISAPYAAQLGTPFEIAIDGPAGWLALPMLAASSANRSVPPFGTLRLDLASLIFLPARIVGASGRVSTFLPASTDPTFLGLAIPAQGFLIDPNDPARSRFTGLLLEAIY